MPQRPKKFVPNYLGDSRERERVRRALVDRERENPAARGYDGEWRKFRARVLEERGKWCVECGAWDDRANLDHIETVRSAPEKRLDPSNVRVLCHSCHSRRTGGESRSFARRVDQIT